MSFSIWLAFFAASWAISFSPGPGALSAMASGIKYGFRHGYWTTIGLNVGIMIQIAIVGAGLGAVLAASDLAFGIIKWLGAGYLIYLGYKQFRTDAAPVAVETDHTGSFRVRDQLTHGILVNITNPKGTIFLLAVVPQFLSPSQPLAIQYVVIAATLCFTDLVAMGCYTSLASRMLKLMRKRQHVRWLNRAFGTLFILAGTLLASLSHHK